LKPENRMIAPWWEIVGLLFLLAILWGFVSPWLKTQDNDGMVIAGFIVEWGLCPMVLIVGAVKIARTILKRLKGSREEEGK